MMQARFDEFISDRALPPNYRDLIAQHYLPLADWIVENRDYKRVATIGINGAQGTGKSTLAAFLQLVLQCRDKWRVAVLSIDDFYLTRAERRVLADRVHPLLRTRGVPGTHDMPLLLRILDKLRNIEVEQSILLPRFDKSTDDRFAESEWRPVAGPLDLVILEGWCVGTMPESAEELEGPANVLEREEDRKGQWRSFVNQKLAHQYRDAWSLLDKLVFLKAPDFEAIYRWRLQQEKELKEGPAVMTADDIRHFIQHYERLTRWMWQQPAMGPGLVVSLDEAHKVAGFVVGNGSQI